MAKKIKKFFDLDYCILISDAKKEKSERIKSKNQLSEKVLNFSRITKEKYKTKKAVYFKLYRYENDGFLTEDTILSDAICKILNLENSDLVKVFEK